MGFSAPATFMDKWPLFVKFGATKKFVFQEMGKSVRDGNMGVDTPVISSTSLDVVFDKDTSKYTWLKRDDASILSIDFVAIFPSLALPVVPKIGDTMLASDLVEYKVNGVCPDPLDMHYELWIRPIEE